MGKFTVDTHLFRELGQLLVGRDSTALVELVKNAYDADAQTVVVFGESLNNPEQGLISIQDDGVGMNVDTFSRGFLRVASRLKDTGERRSARWKRRYTGAKGIGRLAAHKLARRIDVESIPWSKSKGAQRPMGVMATIDWDQVEKAETLDDLEDDAVSVHSRPVMPASPPGTTITLTRLRQKWTPTQLGRFLAEVEGFQAPEVLRNPWEEGFLKTKGLFAEPEVSETDAEDPGFKVDLQGEFAVGESYWPAVAQAASWVLEIDATPDAVRYAVLPTPRKRKESGIARGHYFSEPHLSPKEGPFFHARILLREGAGAAKEEERAWASRAAGIRVYMEGFRVLPYGEPTDDWLLLQKDNSDRSRKLRFLEQSEAGKELKEVEDEGLLLLPNKHYFGAVFLTTSRAPNLSMLVNREGFVPDEHFEHLVTLVRRGVDLSTRIRAATKAAESAEEAKTATAGSIAKPAHPGQTAASVAIGALSQQASDLKSLAANLNPKDAKKVIAAVDKLEHAASVSKGLIPKDNMVLVLASVGTQHAAFVHEINRLLSMAQNLEAAVLALREAQGLPPKLRTQVVKVGGVAGDLRRALERQASYLVDIVTPDARRRRSKQRVVDALMSSWKFVERVAEERGITLQNEIGREVRSPPMFSAELTAVMSNLLSNAVKAAGENGRILASASTDEEGRLRLRLENTGVSVDLKTAEHWFRPFESTTTNVDPVLGQGMGLGLGITRDMLTEIGATISFVKPSRGFATAVEIIFPK
jgi:signal transduction histidine kinase